MKLFDSELKVMELLWVEGEMTAKDIAAKLQKAIGWSKTTTYTVIKKCLEKNAIARQEPGFICRAVITREEARDYEISELVGKMFQGKTDLLVAKLLDSKRMKPQELQRLKKMIESAEGGVDHDTD